MGIYSVIFIWVLEGMMKNIEWFTLFVAVVTTALVMWLFYGIVILIAKGLQGVM